MIASLHESPNKSPSVGINENASNDVVVADDDSLCLECTGAAYRCV